MHFSLYLPFLCNFCTVSPLPHYAHILRLPDHTNCTIFVLRSKRAHCACRTDLLCTAQNYGPAKCAGFGCAFVTFRNIRSVTDSVICYRLLLPKSLRPNGKCLFLLMFSNLAQFSQLPTHWTCTPAKAAPAAPVKNCSLRMRIHWLSDTSNFLRGHLIGAICGTLPVPNPMPCTRPAFMCKLEHPPEHPPRLYRDCSKRIQGHGHGPNDQTTNGMPSNTGGIRTKSRSL